VKDRYVVDTNVLIAASAVDLSSPLYEDATPSDPELREKTRTWLLDFKDGNSRLVLDGQEGILDEYKKKLRHGDLGRQVVLHKMSVGAVDLVHVDYDKDGHGVLDEPLASVIHDLADRKMVAAAVDAIFMHQKCTVAFAGDTDWHDWEAALQTCKVLLEPIIEEWSRQKHAEKQMR